MDVTLTSKPGSNLDQTASATTADKRLFEAHEQRFYASVVKRIAEGDADPNRRNFSLEEAMGAQGYTEYLSIDPNAIADDELFETDGKHLKAKSE